jgi:hypothetical protein
MIKPQKIVTNWKQLPTGLVWYIIGQPKTGKTTALSKWSAKGQEGVLIIDTDLGADFVNGANVIPCVSLNPPYKPLLKEDGTQASLPDGTLLYARDKADNLIVIPPEERGYNYRVGPDQGKPMPVYSLTEIAQWLSSNWDSLPYDTVVLDTIDKISVWNEQRTLAKFGTTAMGQVEWGGDWAEVKEGTLRSFNFFKDLIKRKGGNLVIVSHSKETTIVPAKKGKKAQTQLGPALTGGLATQLLGGSDVIGYTTGDKGDGTYRISFEAYDEVKVGSRLRPIAQKELAFDYNEITNIIAMYNEEEEK